MSVEEKINTLPDKADENWVSLEEWPRRDDEFTGSYWTGIALLDATKDSTSCEAYTAFVHFDAGVAIWWEHGLCDNRENDIDPNRIIALLYIPNTPERFEDRMQTGKQALRDKYGLWR